MSVDVARSPDSLARRPVKDPTLRSGTFRIEQNVFIERCTSGCSSRGYVPQLDVGTEPLPDPSFARTLTQMIAEPSINLKGLEKWPQCSLI